MEQPAETCRNCGHGLPDASNFCPTCGQKNTDGRLSFQALLSEFVNTIFNLDNRIFSTLGALIIPGKLTANYFQGKHIRYYHPVRLFVISAGVFTALMTFKLSKGGLENAKFGLEQRKEIYQRQQEYKRLESLSENVSDAFNDDKVDAALDTLQSLFKNRKSSSGYDVSLNFKNGDFYVDSLANKERPTKESPDSLDINTIVRFSDDPMMVAVSDLLKYNEKELTEKYGVSGRLRQLEFQQRIRIVKGGSKFIFYMIGNTIWMMLIMMPMLALVLKLLYIRRGFLYYEHLVFSFHTHSFMFLVLSLQIILGDNLPDFVDAIIFILSTIYLYLAMKRFYGQRHLKTFLKFSITNLLYLLIITVAGTLTLMASALFY